jgi:hypothetical protein
MIAFVLFHLHKVKLGKQRSEHETIRMFSSFSTEAVQAALHPHYSSTPMKDEMTRGSCCEVASHK